MKGLRRWWWRRQAQKVGRRLVEAEAVYSTRVAIHGRNAYIYAHELARMRGAVEVLIFDLERLNGLLGRKP